MRARYPDRDGFVDNDGVSLFYEVYENEGVTVALVPTWSMFHSRFWKMQIPYLARHFRVVTWDPRGNGRSSRPRGRERHEWREYLRDLEAVLDATDTEQAVLVGFSMSGYWCNVASVLHPNRVLGVVAIAPGSGLGILPKRMEGDYSYTERLDSTEGWAKENVHYIREDYPGYAEFFVSQIFVEPHSTKQIEDAVGWALETDAETVIDSDMADVLVQDDMAAFYRKTIRPLLIIQGEEDPIVAPESSRELARLADGDLVLVPGAGHAPHMRDPVRVNHLIREFVDRVAGGRGTPESNTPSASGEELRARVWARGMSRPKKALYISSPIGLGHVRRDVAIAGELRRLCPELDIEWLAQHPVTQVLMSEGETIHPASEWLASESAHITSEATEHDLHCFQALRRMDEILVANFMIFQEVTEEGLYDLVIGDEAWDVDYYWHENPELKRGSHVWLTDFVGFIPMAEGGEHEAFLTADYNAEMIEHIARFPRIRDRAIFVGNPDDIVPQAFGPGLPKIREWTVDHFDFSGYITGFTPVAPERVAVARDRLGYRQDEKVCIVSVGGSGVGRDLIDKVIAAYPLAKDLIPELRMVVVAGPRIDPESLSAEPGVEIHGYVERLYEHLSVCDLAVVQGGLTTTMELTAAKRPFLYFPLRGHFEQNHHVRHRLDRYRAGRHMDYGSTDPDLLAQAIAQEIARRPAYRDVETDGASRAAALIAELV